MAVAVDPGSGLVHVAGTTEVPDTPDIDLLLAWYTAAGERAGTRAWDGTPGASAPSQDTPVGLAVDPATGDVYVAANIWPDGIAVVSYTRAGTVRWTTRSAPPPGGHLELTGMVRDPVTGNLYLSGVSSSDTDAARALTLAYSPAGTLLWQRQVGDGNVSAVALHVDVDPARGIVYSSGAHDGLLTTAYTVDGEPLWTISEPQAFRETGLAVDRSSGAVYVLGRAGAEGAEDYLTVAYAPTGRKLWSRVEDGGGYDVPAAIDVDRRTGAVFVTGTSASGSAGSDYRTIAYSPAGAVLWREQYDGPAGGDDNATAIAVDTRRGVLYVTGASATRPQPAAAEAAVTLAYAVSGQRLRVNAFTAGAGRRVYPLAMAVDSVRGTVLVTGVGSPTGRADVSSAVTIAYPPAGRPEAPTRPALLGPY